MSVFKTEWKATPFSLLQAPYSLNASQVMLYAYILDEYEHWSKNSKGGYTPSLETLAKVMGKKKRALQLDLDVLRDKGLLKTVQQYNKCSVFVVYHFEHIAEAPQNAPEASVEPQEPTNTATASEPHTEAPTQLDDYDDAPLEDPDDFVYNQEPEQPSRVPTGAADWMSDIFGNSSSRVTFPQRRKAPVFDNDFEDTPF